MASGMKLVKRPRSPNYQFNEVRAEVKKELVPLAQEHVMARARVVDDWGNKVEFEYQIGIGPKQIYILIKLANPSQLLKSGKATIRNLWNWLDKTGTKAHRIPKSGVKLLKFEWGGPGSYVSKTGAGPARYGGPGGWRKVAWRCRGLRHCASVSGE